MSFKDVLIQFKSQIINNENEFKLYQSQITNLKKEIDNLENQLINNNQIIINLKDEYVSLVEQDGSVLNNYKLIQSECSQLDSK